MTGYVIVSNSPQDKLDLIDERVLKLSGKNARIADNVWIYEGSLSIDEVLANIKQEPTGLDVSVFEVLRRKYSAGGRMAGPLRDFLN